MLSCRPMTPLIQFKNRPQTVDSPEQQGPNSLISNQSDQRRHTLTLPRWPLFQNNKNTQNRLWSPYPLLPQDFRYFPQDVAELAPLLFSDKDDQNTLQGKNEFNLALNALAHNQYELASLHARLAESFIGQDHSLSLEILKIEINAKLNHTINLSGLSSLTQNYPSNPQIWFAVAKAKVATEADQNETIECFKTAIRFNGGFAVYREFINYLLNIEKIDLALNFCTLLQTQFQREISAYPEAQYFVNKSLLTIAYKQNKLQDCYAILRRANNLTLAKYFFSQQNNVYLLNPSPEIKSILDEVFNIIQGIENGYAVGFTSSL